jgi:MFS superfamily sulfate permease-like transporter
MNWTKIFSSFEDLCNYEGLETKVDCTFYVLKTSNLIRPKLDEIIEVIPASFVMTVVLIF